LAEERKMLFDEDGNLAASGKTHLDLLQQLNQLDYYKQSYPKSLSNSFGTDLVYPLIKSFPISMEDALRTYVEHITHQIKDAVVDLERFMTNSTKQNLLITGG